MTDISTGITACLAGINKLIGLTDDTSSETRKTA